ncbi:MAG: hypothetical protein GWN01_17090, partial [Nitrosopumilaceae archaeon]|nr:hypothetical protein [Nitrosopumilaceae archaeon]NIU89004.1 hypothetical protein [Nitrosopumilaceae archaeon]NIX63148.1 hypothetical protein [Nitrosopumilaceae archaeon]
MSISKHIYYADSEYPKTVILNHGGSETTVISDSDDDIKPGTKYYRKIWKIREPLIPLEEKKQSWLS